MYLFSSVLYFCVLAALSGCAFSPPKVLPSLPLVSVTGSNGISSEYLNLGVKASEELSLAQIESRLVVGGQVYTVMKSYVSAIGLNCKELGADNADNKLACLDSGGSGWYIVPSLLPPRVKFDGDKEG